MPERAIALAVPFFFLLIGVEILVARRQGRDVYRLNDSLNNLGLGITEQMAGVFVKVALFGGYLFLYEHYSLFVIPGDSLLAWIAMFLGVDLCYYWFHRATHEVAVLWGAHVGHHQSEEYNLTVALRQDAFQQVFGWAFYLPLALLGFPPLMFLTMAAVNTLYQFWIHTRLIGKLGPLEWVLNTPSHHRVHHGSDAKYLDKNYGGTLIVWDRLFGSFKAEEEEPHYGIVKPLSSWNVLWANVHVWVELARATRQVPGTWDRLRLWLKPPGWRPGAGVVLPPQDFAKYDPPVPLGLQLYAAVHFLPALAGGVAVLHLSADGAETALLASIAALVVLTLTTSGALLEGRAWGFGLELGRLCVVAATAVASSSGATAALVLLLGAASGWWLLRYRGLFWPAPRALAVS
jgi:alkylglycerol monooxygenase